MKKIFCICAAILIAIVGTLLGVLGSIKKSLSFEFNKPLYINVFNRSAATTQASGLAYYSTDPEYSKVLEMLEKMTTTSLLNLLLKNGSIRYNIDYGKDNYRVYDTDMKSEYLVIELVYDKEQNVVVYEGNDTTTIAFYDILFVIPYENKFNEIVIYNSHETNLRETKYKENVPFIIKGNPKELINYVNSL